MANAVFQPGDVGLAHGAGLVDWSIRFAESLRYGRRSPEARWNHAFLIVNASGALIEAQGRGVVRNDMQHEYEHGDYTVLRPPFPPGGGAKAVATMATMLGDRYGFLEIASEALSFVTETKLRFGIAGQQICSGAVSYALDQGGVPMGEDMAWNSPADILKIALDQKWQWVAGVQLPRG